MDIKNSRYIKLLGPLKFALISALLGILTGIGAVVFRGLIALVHNLVFLGKFSFVYDATLHTPASPWGAFIILGPVIGGSVVVFLIQKFAPEAKGHGVPEVIDAVYYYRGVIRPVVAAVKAAASSVSIGTGGSVGREGPIVQIGSSFGSTIGQILNLPVWQRITLIAAGTGGGIAATFNTPIGGMIFAFELMMQEFSIRTLIPLAITTVIATYVGQIFFGTHPAFVIPGFETPYFHIENPVVLLAYGGLGVILGVASALFIKSIYAFEDFFDKKVSKVYYVRHLVGMLIVGVMFYVLMKMRGHYFTEGVGYATIQDILTGSLTGASFLFALFCLKLVATSTTLGSGASGGIFSPSLFLGATLGGVYGFLLHTFFPGLDINSAAFAVAGMAGLAGGVTGAAIAAIVMIFEMTLNYNVMLPMVITVTISYGVRKLLSTESIYTMKLARRKHFITEVLQRDLLYMKRAVEIMDTQFDTVDSGLAAGAFLKELPTRQFAIHYLVVSGGNIIGVIKRDKLIEAAEYDATAKIDDIVEKIMSRLPRI
ncbi:MAG: chloride channel protein [Nitrospiraceae bacterium]|nr:chloride channel protein [Nitrospiraceae bacterium]